MGSDFWFTGSIRTLQAAAMETIYIGGCTEPDVLVLMHYPYMANGGFRSDYYANLEVIRKQALLGGIDFWSYSIRRGNGAWRVPSGSEMRYQGHIRTWLIAKRYIYFNVLTHVSKSGGESFNNGIILPNGTKNISYTWAQNINAGVPAVGWYTNEFEIACLYHSGRLAFNGYSAS